MTCGRGYKVRTRAPLTDSAYRYDSIENSAAIDDDDHQDDNEDPCEEDNAKETVACTAEIPTCDIPASTVVGK